MPPYRNSALTGVGKFLRRGPSADRVPHPLRASAPGACRDANISTRVLRETFLYTFKEAIQKGGTISVMGALGKSYRGVYSICVEAKPSQGTKPRKNGWGSRN
jgi:hypothetical protein